MQIWFSFFLCSKIHSCFAQLSPGGQSALEAGGGTSAWARESFLATGGDFFVQRKEGKECVILPQASPTGLGFSMEALWRSSSAALLDQWHPQAAKPDAPQLPWKCPSLCYYRSGFVTLTLTIKNQEHPVCHNIHIFTGYRNSYLLRPLPLYFFFKQCHWILFCILEVYTYLIESNPDTLCRSKMFSVL